MCDQKFFLCEECGNLVGLIHSSGVPMICCGQPMTFLDANTVDASREKHVPVVSVNGNKVAVTVGSTIHPMIEEHYIEWIYLQTKNGGQRKCVKIGGEPSATFSIYDDEPVAAFAYCNLHGLWKADIE